MPTRCIIEARLALRLAILVSSQIIVPAVSYYQSKFCRDVLSEFSDLMPLGIIRLATDANSFEFFFENRLLEYKSTDKEYTLYKNHLKKATQVEFGLLYISENATESIHSQWQNKSIHSDLNLLFRDNSLAVKFPSDFRQRTEGLVDDMGSKAFIARNVYPYLFPNNDSNAFLENKLKWHLNEMFFNSIAENLIQSIMISDLVYLPNIAINTISVSLSYQKFYTFLQKNDINLFNEIKVCNPLQLLSLSQNPLIIEGIKFACEPVS